VDEFGAFKESVAALLPSPSFARERAWKRWSTSCPNESSRASEVFTFGADQAVHALIGRAPTA